MEQLSPREYVVLRLVAMGNSDREIAGKLRLSVRTIQNTLASACSKLGVPSALDATRTVAAYSARISGSKGRAD